MTEEVGRLSGVQAIDVNLETKLVRVTGTGLKADDIVAAISAAGYEATRAGIHCRRLGRGVPNCKAGVTVNLRLLEQRDG